MGDRAQLQVTNGEQSFYLYTHWHGESLAEILADGLKEADKKGRAIDGDWTYGLAVVAQRMAARAGDLPSGTGLGIGFVPHDNDGEDRILVLDTKDGTVFKRIGGAYDARRVPWREFVADPKIVGWE